MMPAVDCRHDGVGLGARTSGREELYPGSERTSGGVQTPPSGKSQMQPSTSQGDLQVTDGGRSTRVQSDLPHLVSLGGGRLSTAVTFFPLPPGNTTIGTRDAIVPQDIVIQGPDVDAQHCYIVNDSGSVQLYPISHAITVDGSPVREPRSLDTGCMLCLGRSTYFRFNHPQEAKRIRNTKPKDKHKEKPGKYRTEAHGNFNPLFDDNSSSTSQVRFRGVPQPPPKPTPAKPTSPKPSSPSLAHKGLPAPLGCDRQSFESRRYRDSLEGADFANKLSRFENLVHDRIKKPCASQISPRGYSSSQKKKLTGSPRVQRSLSPRPHSPRPAQTNKRFSASGDTSLSVIGSCARVLNQSESEDDDDELLTSSQQYLNSSLQPPQGCSPFRSGGALSLKKPSTTSQRSRAIPDYTRPLSPSVKVTASVTVQQVPNNTSQSDDEVLYDEVPGREHLSNRSRAPERGKYVTVTPCGNSVVYSTSTTQHNRNHNNNNHTWDSKKASKIVSKSPHSTLERNFEAVPPPVPKSLPPPIPAKPPRVSAKIVSGSQKSTSSDSSDLTSHPGEKLFTKDTAVTRVSLQHIDQSGNSKSIKSANSDTASSDTTSTNSQLSQQSGKKGLSSSSIISAVSTNSTSSSGTNTSASTHSGIGCRVTVLANKPSPDAHDNDPLIEHSQDSETIKPKVTEQRSIYKPLTQRLLQSIVKNSSGNTVPTASTNLAFDQEFDDPWETHSRAGKKKRDDCRQGSNERNCETDIGDTAANLTTSTASAEMSARTPPVDATSHLTPVSPSSQMSGETSPGLKITPQSSSYVSGSKLFPNNAQYGNNNNNHNVTSSASLGVVNGDVVYHQTSPGSGTTYISSPYGVHSTASKKVVNNKAKPATDIGAFDFLVESGLEAELRELEETINLVSQGPSRSVPVELSVDSTVKGTDISVQNLSLQDNNVRIDQGNTREEGNADESHPSADSSTPPITSDDSISITSEDSYDLTASQQDLRVLHKRMVEERKKEQEAANKEQQRLDDILNICATYQREMEEEMVKQHGGTASGDGGAGHGVARSESRNSMTKIKTNGSLTKLSSPSLLHKDVGGSNSLDYNSRRRSSNCSDGSEEDLLSGIHSSGSSNNGTIKKQPLSNSNSMPAFTNSMPVTGSKSRSASTNSAGLSGSIGLSNTVSTASPGLTSSPGLSSSGLTPTSAGTPYSPGGPPRTPSTLSNSPRVLGTPVFSYSPGFHSPSRLHTSSGASDKVSPSSDNVFWSNSTTGIYDSVGRNSGASPNATHPHSPHNRINTVPPQPSKGTPPFPMVAQFPLVLDPILSPPSRSPSDPIPSTPSRSPRCSDFNTPHQPTIVNGIVLPMPDTEPVNGRVAMETLDVGYGDDLTPSSSGVETSSEQSLNCSEDSDQKSQYDRCRLSHADCIRRIQRLKQQILDVETQQQETIREMEMERALLEGEQRNEVAELRADHSRIEHLKEQEKNKSDIEQRQQKHNSRMEAEQKKLRALESQYNSTRLAVTSSDASVKDMVQLENQLKHVQEQLEQQRKMYEEMEFQHLEVEAHYEEERERLESSLVTEKQELITKYQTRQGVLQQIEHQQHEILAQVKSDIENMEKQRLNYLEQFRQEKMKLERLESRMKELSRQLNIPNDAININAEQLNALLDTPVPAGMDVNQYFKQCTPDDSPKMKRKGVSSSEYISDNRGVHWQDGYGGQGTYDNPAQLQGTYDNPTQLQGTYDNPAQIQATYDNHNSYNSNNSYGVFESEDSSLGSSEANSEEKETSVSSGEEHLEKLLEMERLLIEAGGDQLGLLDEVREQEAELLALKIERQKRKKLERQLHDESLRRDELVRKEIRLREQQRLQTRPLTRYLPISSRDLDLRAHIESAGHQLEACKDITIDSTSCRGALLKMGSRFRTWNRRWFVFDRVRRSLLYFVNRESAVTASTTCASVNSPKARGGIYFQSIEEVYVDHLKQVKSPSPKLTFCVKTLDRTYYLVAPTPEAMRIWIDVIFTGAEGYQQYG